MILGTCKNAHMGKWIEKLRDRLNCFSSGDLKLCSTGEILHDCSGEIAVALEGAIFNAERHGFKDNSALPHIIEENLAEGFEKAVRAALESLDGEYTFVAFYKGKIALARDTVGSRPLYYTKEAFSSSRNLLPEAEVLKPGEILFLSEGGVSSVEIERLPDKIEVSSPAVELREALVEAVKKRAAFAERFGILYSGGIDSAVITKIALDLGYKPRLYMVGTEGSLDEQRSREAEELFGLEVIFREVSLHEVKEALPQVVQTIGTAEPLQVSIALPLYFATEKAGKKGERYILTGQGGDELFGGYYRYLSFTPEKLQEELLRDLLNLHSENLERDYSIAARNQMEILSPYLDKRVIRIAISLSPEMKVYQGRRKVVLREVAELLGLPESIVEREKKAMQYSSGINKILEKIAGRKKREYLKKYLMV